jgi:hypothetical protein
MSTQSDPTLIRVYPARLSFPHLFKARSFMGAADAEAYYSTDLLIPKDAKDAILAINNAAKAAVERAVATKFNGKMPSLPTMQKPWSDGDAKDPDTGDYFKLGLEYRGVIVLKTKSKTKPQVLTRSREPAVEEDVWPGQEVHALVRFNAYSFGGKKGVTAYLNAILLTGRGDRFDGRVDAVDAFAGVEDDFGGGNSGSPANDAWADDELLGNAA